MQLQDHIQSVFKEKFLQQPLLVFSPGRINLIGEHVDYNDGYVMPAAIDKGIYFATALNNSDDINFYSVDFNESLSLKLKEVKKMDSWKNYVLGVVNEFQVLHLAVKGFNCVFGGNIPIGAGMSSSAATEGGIAFAINELHSFGLTKKDLALLCQRAEHNFPGVMCGIMDQYANIFGKKDHVILLDCMNIEHEYLPLHLQEYSIILINSKVHHSLASSEYNKRRIESEEGLRILKEALHIHSFRDIKNTEELVRFKSQMNENVYNSCLYIVEEIYRTKKAAELLKQNEIEAFGELMFETHEGLKNLYNVSCREIDYLVDCAHNDSNVIGSRQMGGGFGGCTINIIKNDAVQSFTSKTVSSYREKFAITAEVYEVHTADGTKIVTA